MRTHNEDFAVGADRNLNYISTTTISNTTYNNNSNYNGYNSSQSSSNAIPYHARENSLPFSYGQIGRTSTPLRSVKNSAGGASDYLSAIENSRSGGSYGNNSNTISCNKNKYDSSYLSNVRNNNANYDLKYGGVGTGASAADCYRNGSDNYFRDIMNEYDSDASTIKTQPKLKSPLLVRKTLKSSNSPTRANGTNAISSSNYHYNYSNDGGGGSVVGGRLTPSTNGYNSDIYGTPRPSRTPTRNDFEEMLRERREKVFNEYRDTSATSSQFAVVPPPRQFRTEDTVDAVYAIPRHRNYNYDFEFNLNLDEDLMPVKEKVPPQPPVRRTSTNALDHYTNNGYPNRNISNTFGKREQIQREQYRTRDIELPPLTSRDVERNYHTLSSTNTTNFNTNINTYNGNGDVADAGRLNRDFERSTTPQWNKTTTRNGDGVYNYGRDLATERYFETFEQRRQAQSQSAMPQPQSIQQQQRTEYTTTTTYGNGNAPGYGYNSNSNSSSNRNFNYNNNNYNHNNNNNNYGNHNGNNVTETVVYRSSMNAAPTPASPQITSSSAAPIYATSTKQVMQSNATYRNEPTMPTAATTTPTTPISPLAQTSTTTVDYSSSTSSNLVKPTAATTPNTSTQFSRPETPAFPVTPRTPFGSSQNGYSPTGRRLDQLSSGGNHQYSSETIYQLTAPRSRLNSNFSSSGETQEVAAHLVKFAKDSSKFWYKPNLSRDEAISLLLNAPPGTFVVRDSTTYKNAYGLVLRVAQPPPNSNSTGKPDDLVRHFLIEPTTRGVRLKGCQNEPVFTSLSALVYEHSINQLALPCLLRIPEEDISPSRSEPTPAQKQLLTQGAACNVLYLYSYNTESLTGEEAIRKAIRQLYAQKQLPTPTEVHFKVSKHGITLTDNTRKLFFRKHYAADMISFCAIDPDHRLWTMQEPVPEGDKTTVGALKKTIFAFVARRSPSSKDNMCHVFCDLAINQPASAIISFANKTLPIEKQRNYVL